MKSKRRPLLVPTLFKQYPGIGEFPPIWNSSLNKMSQHMRKKQLKMRKKSQWFGRFTAVERLHFIFKAYSLSQGPREEPAFRSVCSVSFCCGKVKSTRWTQAKACEAHPTVTGDSPLMLSPPETALSAPLDAVRAYVSAWDKEGGLSLKVDYRWLSGPLMFPWRLFQILGPSFHVNNIAVPLK